MAAITTRSGLISYCLRKLGSPVVEINVAPEQLEDKVDDALQLYQEFHDDATVRTFFKYQVTSTDVTNGYVPISTDIIFLSKLFKVQDFFGSSGGMFDIRYQMAMNDMAWLNFDTGIAYYVQMQQYLDLLDMTLNGEPQVTFSRNENKLYIHGEWWNGDIKEGDYLIAEVLQILDPETNTSIYNSMFMKDYTSALIKLQWGQNMSKFEGVQLPGGVTISGRQLVEDAKEELTTLRERMRLEQELPVDFLIG